MRVVLKETGAVIGKGDVTLELTPKEFEALRAWFVKTLVDPNATKYLVTVPAEKRGEGD